MPLNGKTKQEILQEFRHAEILEAARRVFSEKGFEQASVDDIAHAAGVAKGTVYLYYPSKRELYMEALKSGLESMCSELENRVHEAGSTEAKIRAFMSAKVRYFEKHRDFFRIYHSEFAQAALHPTCTHKDLKDYHNRQLELLAVALQEGIRTREIRKMPVEDAAFAILHLTRSIIYRRLLGWVVHEPAHDIEFMFDLTWKGLAGK
jgi:AcrR family transcriptional regulator